jgi:hypothetical protein
MMIIHTVREVDYVDYQSYASRLVIYLETCLSPEDALEFANEHSCYQSLCRLALLIGPSTFKQYIVENVPRWADANFLDIALDTIYK